MAADKHKGHVICMPSPYQGHIKSMLKLAKLLHHRGIHITFVNTEFNQTRFLRSSTSSCSTFSDPHFRFETIPDGLPPSAPDFTQDPIALFKSTHRNFSDVPPVSCVVSDAWLPFTVKAGYLYDPISEDLGGIPVVMFASYCLCLQFNGLYTIPCTP